MRDGIRWRIRTGASWQDVPNRCDPRDRAYHAYRRLRDLKGCRPAALLSSRAATASDSPEAAWRPVSTSPLQRAVEGPSRNGRRRRVHVRAGERIGVGPPAE
ncbi:hypothetical protein GCM10018773_30780 [Streptomyces candidus]|nr:hypothetical protein GCM10018773_30780 [Streptomyces candidus]